MLTWPMEMMYLVCLRLPRWTVILYVNVITFARKSYSCSHCTGFCLPRSACKIPSRHLSWRFNVVYLSYWLVHLYSCQVGYLPDGTPMNTAGNCINHPETIGPDPHSPGWWYGVICSSFGKQRNGTSGSLWQFVAPVRLGLEPSRRTSRIFGSKL